MAQQTLLEIAQLNGSDAVVGLIEENLTFAPELSVLPARTIRGTSYKTVIRTAYPGVAFRNANEGATLGKSTFINRTHECFILNAPVRADVAVAKAYEDGEDAWKAIEASGVMKQALIEVGSQVIYGTSVDSKGFPGLTEIHTALNNGIVIDAGGTTATTGSSVWALQTGNQGVSILLGNNSSFELSEWTRQQIDVSSTTYEAHVATLTAWVGMQVGSKNSIGRLKDCTEDSGKECTDTQIAKLLALFPVGNKPNLLLMSRRSARQLQVSRTVTINSGPGSAKAGGNLEIVAPMPESAFGIPIIVTDSITDTETLS